MRRDQRGDERLATERVEVAPLRTRRTWGLRTLAGLGGPVLIVASVVTVLHGFVFGGRLSTQHPDVLALWLPNFCYLGKSLAAGHIPAWNPYSMGGVPLAADPQSGWMYLPAMLLFTAFPCGLALRLYIVLQPSLAGLGLYAFLRSERLSRTAATCGGLALALVLASTRLGLFLPFPAAIAWTTVTLAACSRAFNAPTWSRRLVWLALTAVAWGQIAAAHLSFGIILGTLALATYLIARIWRSATAGRQGREPGGDGSALPADPPVRTVLAAIAVLVPALLVVNLAFLLPRLDYLRDTSFNLSEANLAKGAGVHSPAWPLKFSTTPGAYMGAVILLLSLGAWWSRRHRALAVAFGLYGAGMYLLGLGAVSRRLTPRLEHVPLLRIYTHFPQRYSMGLLLAIPVLGAIGIEAWRHARADARRLLIAGGGLLLWFVVPLAIGVSPSRLALLWVAGTASAAILVVAARRPVWLALVPVLLAAELVTNGLGGLYPHGLFPQQSGRADPTGALATGWFGPVHAPTVDPAAYLRPGLIALAIRAGDASRYASLPPSTTPRGELTRQDPSRWPLLANQRSMLFHLEDVSGIDNPVQLIRYWKFVRAVSPVPMDYNSSFLFDPSPAVLDLFQVRWIIAEAGRSPAGVDSQVVREGEWALYERPDAPPRASFVSSWVVEPSAESALSEVTGAGFDPSARVVLERNPGVSRAEGSAPATVSYRANGAQAATVTVDAPAAGVLLVRTPFDRRWRATVDGRAVPLLVADYFLQGVPVAAGRHVVALSYRDPAIGYGMVGSVVGLLLLLSAAAALSRRIRHR